MWKGLASLKEAVGGEFQSFDEFQQRRYFTALDGLRALSIFLVLLHHCPRVGEHNFIRILQENGRYGVGVFFLISGFLICTLLIREASKTGKVSLWKFYGRRAVRLLPLYYSVLIAEAILIFGLHQYSPENRQLFVDKLPSYAFYFSNWLPTMTQGPFFCSWSLAVEEQFYLTFALLLVFCRRRIVLVITSALLLKVVVYQVFGAVDAGSRVCLILFSYREPILLGVLAAFALNTEGGYELLQRLLGSAWVRISAAGLTVAWLSAHLMRHESAWDAQLFYILATVAMIGIVMLSKAPVLENGFLVHVGKVSYGIYLLHMFVLNFLKKAIGADQFMPTFLIAAVMVILLASLVHRYFELPIINAFKTRLSAEPILKTPVVLTTPKLTAEMVTH